MYYVRVHNMSVHSDTGICMHVCVFARMCIGMYAHIYVLCMCADRDLCVCMYAHA